MSDPSRWIGAILVGGASRRMGVPKRSLAWRGGATLEERVEAALRAAGAAEIVRVGDATGLASIADTRPGEGPLAAVEALLRAGRASIHVVCPCDMPELAPELLTALLAAPAATLAVFAVSGEPGPRPLPMRLHADALPLVQRLLDQGQRSLRALLAEADVATTPLTRMQAEALRDVDRPEDVEGGLGT